MMVGNRWLMCVDMSRNMMLGGGFFSVFSSVFDVVMLSVFVGYSMMMCVLLWCELIL